MRVMTFNLRFENPLDGPNDWIHRREMILHLIRRYHPSILGTQEGKWHQLLYLEKHLPQYALQAEGRILDEVSQYPTLYFLKQDFEVLEGGEFWLSETPQVPRSKDWGSAYPRMVSYAHFKDGKRDRTFWAAVTHLDHMADHARYQQAKLLKHWVQRKKDAAILMGDFNDHPLSAVHELLTGTETRLVDTWQKKGYPEGSENFTIHGFRGVPEKGRIDWILVSPQFRVLEAKIIKDHFEGRYPSDHFPYLVDLDWT